MTKKILCLVLSIVMLFSMFVMSVWAEASESDGYILIEDFEGDDYAFDNVTVENGVALLANSAANSAIKPVASANLPSRFVYEFDVECSDNTAEIYVLFRNNDNTKEPYSSIMIVPKSFEANKMYTYRFIIDASKLIRSNAHENFAAIEYYRKEVGSDTWIKGVYDRSGVITDGFAQASDGSNIVYEAGTPAIRYLNSYASSIADKTVGFWLWSSNPSNIRFDNVKVMKKASFVGGVQFLDNMGQVTELLSEGEVTPLFSIENYDGLTQVDAISVVYDENNQMIRYSTECDIQVEMGTNEIYGAAVDTVGGARVESYLWTSVSDAVPLEGAYGVLGEADVTAESKTTAFLGASSDDIKSNSFTCIDREVMANSIVIEGMHSTEANTFVTVKIEENDTGKNLLLGQFNTADNGSFKKTFEINPELCTGAGKATVTVSGIDTTALTFEIPVFTNWEQMRNDFFAMTRDTAQDYFENYKENLAYLAAGDAETKKVELEALTEADYNLISFVRSHNEYEDTSYRNVVRVSVRLVECLDEVEDFERAFAEAKNGETEKECVSAIRSLLENCSFMEFSTEGVSNVDAICAVLNASEEMTLEGIYADFSVAYQNQKTAEESTVPGFTRDIFNGEDLKQFFADNETVLGVNPESYSDIEYAVMYVVYDEKNYDGLTTYAQVNEAIVFLDNYIKEYNRFMEDITNAAASTKNWEEIRTLLNAEYKYIEIDLADETAVVSKEYLYSRLIDMNCESLWTVEEAFETAVANQTDYEIAAKDAYNTIMDETAIRAMFAEYGDMMGFGNGKVLTEAQVTVFLEVYQRFNLVAPDYAKTVAHLNTLFGKLEGAQKLIADVNTEAESSDWAGIKAIYEGEAFEEFVGADVSIPLINDIRSMYMRIAAEAPFESLSELRRVFDTAYSNQQAYEEAAGGYESFDDEELYFDDTAWTISVSGNVVNISGKVAGNGERNLIIAVYDETNPMPVYFKQIVTNIKGQFERTIVLNPALYNADDEATLKIGGDGVNTYAFSPFGLYSVEELEAVVDEFLNISSKAKMKKFFEDNCELLGMSIDTSDDRIMEALFFLYDRDKKAGLFKEFEDVTDVIKGTKEDSGIEALMVQTQKLIACLEALTEAANEKNGSGVGRWSKIKTQVELAMNNGWISPSVSGRISSESALYGGMAKKDYDYMSQVESAYETAWSAALVKNESGGGGITGGNTSNGGSGTVLSGNGASSATIDKTVIGGSAESDDTGLLTNLPEHPVDPFNDLTSDYSWARTSINKLRNYGLVKGDGNGNYRPGDSISREEFLTMLLDVFGVERKSGGLDFSDAENGAWYYDTVYTAYEMGIIKGYDDATFGIGDPISRADMSVMVCRMLENKNISLASEEKSVVFYDYADIPEYAYSSVQKLQRANILNGDAFGNFNPKSKLTRAEAAVVLWPIFDSIKDLITYSWTKTY